MLVTSIGTSVLMPRTIVLTLTSIRKHVAQDAVPRAVCDVAAAPPPNRLPWSEVLTRQVTSSDTCPVSVDNSLDDATNVLKRLGSLAGMRGQERLGPRPLLISEVLKTVLRSHPSSLSVPQPRIKESYPR